MDPSRQHIASEAAHAGDTPPLHRAVTRDQLIELNVTIEAGRHFLDGAGQLLSQARDDAHPASLDRLPADRVDAALTMLGDGLRQLDELLTGIDPLALGIQEADAIVRSYVPRQWGRPA